jgi:hypothetical protein
MQPSFRHGEEDRPLWQSWICPLPLLLQTEKVPPQIKVGLDAKICFTEGDEDGNSKNGVGVEIADANPIIITELAQERVVGIFKSVLIEIFENYNFARTGIRIALTN